MSGLVALYDRTCPVRANTTRFLNLLRTAAMFKTLTDAEETQINSDACLAAKFDTTSSLHKGVVIDPTTQSWLIAVGSAAHEEYRHSDNHLQKLLTDYIHNGPSALARCDGQFAFVIYNKYDNTLSIVSDPAGLVGIYYGEKEQQVVVSTSALAVATALNSAPDIENSEFWLRTGRLFDEMTHWNGVYRASAGSVVRFANGETRTTTYWSPTIAQELRKMPSADLPSHAHALLVRAFSRVLQCERRVWTELTGGFDTRLVSMVVEQTGTPSTRISQAPHKHPDAIISRALAEKKGWDYVNLSLPDTWGTERLNWLERAVGKADGRLDAVSLTADLWGYSQRNAIRTAAALSGAMGELCRTSGWLGGVFRQHPPPIFQADRANAVRKCFERRLDEVRQRYLSIPNATEEDAGAGIYIYRGTSHEGAYLSAAMGQLRYIIPMALKDIMVCALSVRSKWRQRSCLVRHMLERYDPILASNETTDGGPAGPIRPTPDFLPYFWRNYGQKALGKILPRLRPIPAPSWSAPPPGLAFNWRLALLQFAEDSNLLTPGSMRSGMLYDSRALQAFAAKARTEEFSPTEEKFLNRIITLEMCMRAVANRQSAYKLSE